MRIENKRVINSVLLPCLAGVAMASAGLYVASIMKLLETISTDWYIVGGAVAFLVCLASSLWLWRLMRISGVNHPKFKRIDSEKDDSNS